MEICVDRHTKLDYAEVLDDIAMVICKMDDRENFSRIDLRDRTSVCNNNYPWYKGAFGNCLIYLNSGRTDLLYLIPYMALDNFLWWEKTETEKLEKYAKHTIRRV